MDKSPPIDAVDRILAQWQRERPDLDCSPMGPIGRLKRCAMLLEPQVEVAFTRHELVRWEFDMLATLRRAGAPFILSPTQLFSTLMITSGTMTHRLKALEKLNAKYGLGIAVDFGSVWNANVKSYIDDVIPAGQPLVNESTVDENVVATAPVEGQVAEVAPVAAPVEPIEPVEAAEAVKIEEVIEAAVEEIVAIVETKKEGE